MLFTWSTKNLCIVFPQWRVTGTLSLLISLLLIVLLTAGYEGVRQLTRRFEVAHAKRLSAYTTAAVGGRDSRKSVEQRGKITMASLYAVQVFYSFFIMLLFMTYNGFVMLAVAVGAFVGYLAFGDDTSASKTVACH
ncbi:copper transporter family protein [Aspergillus uvarum CBS 121591]|uniref:Copper transport protein n=1 Tax=Aspergillus uvarum CBS 121591 TaxID=1448315 RepID=A0A319C185_9EURO|nr:copper transporter family protein [Aspergillus uvarum CBS 121591]PYH79776.1 copper transporter family protein [Aspergillus uvarum CBS 121591]